MAEKLSMGMGKPLPPTLPDQDIYTVEFDGTDDPLHPYNWKTSLKLFTSMLACLGTYIVSFNSAVFAPATQAASTELGVSRVVGALGTTLYVLGFAAGPLVWAPSSELWGRRWPLTISMLGGGTFTMASAAAPDMQRLAIFRFLAGVCGAGQLTVVPGVLADMFDNTYRGVAIQLYALTVFGGPFTAPSVGGFIATSYLTWRWALYLPAILSLANGAVSFAFLRETYAPCVLVGKAAALRRQTGNWGIQARQETVDIGARALVDKYLTRPLVMLATEPVLLFVSMYMSFIYGLVYCLLTAYPVVFEDVHAIMPGVSGLPLLALLMGQMLALIFMLSQHAAYVRKLVGNDNVPVPEWRLAPTLIGAPVFALGIFLFGWTGFDAEIHWAAPTLAGLLTGFGILCVFLPCFNYLVDAYLPLAASAVAANIMLRSSIAAGFPLFSRPLFESLGVQWACTLLGCLAVIMIPIPFAFRIYGARLRGKSRILQQAEG